MELERQPQRKPGPHARSRNPAAVTSSSERIQSTATVAAFERVSYAREVCYIMAAIFITIGLVGFVASDLIGAHLSSAHNYIHLISGVAALICAYNGRSTAQKFALGFGAFYGILGVLGFILGAPAEPTVGNTGRDSALWILSPGVLELGTSDHILHLIFAAIFIGSALIRYQRRNDAGLIYH